MGEVKELFINKNRFGILSTLAKLCLAIPVANADSERMFSILRKIATEARSELNNDTICALMCAKQNSLENCYSYNPSEKVLKDAKSACVTYNESLVE